MISASASVPQQLSHVLLRRSAWFIALVQACLILSGLIIAWLLRFDFSLPYLTLLLATAPILISVRLAAIGIFGLFHGHWRFTGVSDLGDIVKAVLTGSAGFWVVTNLFLGITGFPRSIYVLEPILTIGLLAGVRLVSRVIFESVWTDMRSARRLAIIGAGAAAQMILRELRQPGANCIAVACFDDEPSKRGLRIQGVPVMGAVDELPRILSRHPVDEILIAVPRASTVQMRRFVAICERTNTKFRTVPALRELISGEVSVTQLREVKVEDLLARKPVHIDLRSVGPEIKGRTVLVTGAAGSIGSELCRQLIQFGPSKLICVDRSETGVFYLDRSLKNETMETMLIHCVADVADRSRMNRICGTHRPDVIFHASAYKHAPMMESCPGEAVKNNVIALLGLLEMAQATGCRAFVLISSDKSVNPANAMGATKRVGELILCCRPSGAMRCMSVRFGNVLGSHGSVVPLLQEQIRNGSEITITHPDVSRFFMTVHEAVSLVLQAFAIGSHGQILVLDMGRPVPILDLAKTLIHLSGRSSEEIRIRFTGLRPGEKLHEELFYPGEKIVPTRFPEIRGASGEGMNWTALEEQLRDLQEAVVTGNDAAVRAKLMSIVSTGFYRPNRLPSRRVESEASKPLVLRRAAGQN